MIVFDFEQGSEAWHEWRKSGIGASDVPAIMGCSPYEKPWGLYARKTGNGKPVVQNDAMRKGVELEPKIRAYVSAKSGVDFAPVCVGSSDHPWAIASLDGFTADGGGCVLECKHVGKDAFAAFQASRLPPENHLCQMWYQAEVTGAAMVFYACTHDGDAFDYVVLEHETLLDAAKQNGWTIEAVHEFWKALIHGQGVCSDAVWELSEELHDLEVKAAADLERIETLRDAMKEQGKPGDFTRHYALTERKGSETLDKKALAADGIDLSKYTKTGKPSKVLLKI